MVAKTKLNLGQNNSHICESFGKLLLLLLLKHQQHKQRNSGFNEKNVESTSGAAGQPRYLGRGQKVIILKSFDNS